MLANDEFLMCFIPYELRETCIIYSGCNAFRGITEFLAWIPKGEVIVKISVWNRGYEFHCETKQLTPCPPSPPVPPKPRYGY